MQGDVPTQVVAIGPPKVVVPPAEFIVPENTGLPENMTLPLKVGVPVNVPDSEAPLLKTGVPENVTFPLKVGVPTIVPVSVGPLIVGLFDNTTEPAVPVYELTPDPPPRWIVVTVGAAAVPPRSFANWGITTKAALFRDDLKAWRTESAQKTSNPAAACEHVPSWIAKFGSENRVPTPGPVIIRGVEEVFPSEIVAVWFMVARLIEGVPVEPVTAVGSPTVRVGDAIPTPNLNVVSVLLRTNPKSLREELTNVGPNPRATATGINPGVKFPVMINGSSKIVQVFVDVQANRFNPAVASVLKYSSPTVHNAGINAESPACTGNVCAAAWNWTVPVVVFTVKFFWKVLFPIKILSVSSAGYVNVWAARP
jgi:hypothetical protein